MDYLLGAISTNCGHTFCWRCIDEALLMNSGNSFFLKDVQFAENRFKETSLEFAHNLPL